MTKENEEVLDKVRDNIVMILAIREPDNFISYFMTKTEDENIKRLAQELVYLLNMEGIENISDDTNQIVKKLRRELDNGRHNE